jgi:hypothetical protein
MPFQKGPKNFQYKHGLWDSVEYDAFQAMHQRCEHPKNKQYPNYGGRGIKVCNRWKTFIPFFEDMGLRPSPRHSIDRINNNGDYSPKNCRWATVKVQSSNRRNNRFYKGLTITQWGERLNIRPKTIWERMRIGWSIKKAIFTPPRIYRS